MSTVPNVRHTGRTAHMLPEPSAEMLNTRSQKRLQSPECARKSGHKKRASIFVHAFPKICFHQLAVRHCSNDNLFSILTDRIH